LGGAARTFPIKTTFFDTGDVQSVTDPLNHAVTHTIDGRTCATTATLTADAQNALGHKTTTTVDCFTGQVLTVVHPNAQQSCNAYDNLGRLVRSAGPGEDCTPANAGSWIDYAPLGVNGPQNTTSHARDGTSDGRYVKTYLVGLGRTIAVCSEADPAFSG